MRKLTALFLTLMILISAAGSGFAESDASWVDLTYIRENLDLYQPEEIDDGTLIYTTLSGPARVFAHKYDGDASYSMTIAQIYLKYGMLPYELWDIMYYDPAGFRHIQSADIFIGSKKYSFSNIADSNAEYDETTRCYQEQLLFWFDVNSIPFIEAAKEFISEKERTVRMVLHGDEDIETELSSTSLLDLVLIHEAYTKIDRAGFAGMALDGSMVMTVSDVTRTLKLNKKAVTLKRTADKPSPACTLKATVTPEDSSAPALKWSSSDKAVAKVNSKGKVTAVSAGTAKITCALDDGSGVRAECLITVEDEVSVSLELNASKKTLTRTAENPAPSFTLKAAVTPGSSKDVPLVWSSSDENVATVSKKGKVTAVNPGKAVITVTADNGSGASASCTVTVKTQLSITKQPASSKAAKAGDKVKISVEAAGDGLTYQWYVKTRKESEFSKSGGTKKACTVTVDDAHNGCQAYCIIADQYGTSIVSDIVTLSIATPVRITAQPKNASGKVDSKVSVSVKASGDGLTYQWYVRKKNSKKFSLSSVTKSTYSVTMTKDRDGLQAYCVVTDRYGNTVQSDTVTLTAAK